MKKIKKNVIKKNVIKKKIDKKEITKRNVTKNYFSALAKKKLEESGLTVEDAIDAGIWYSQNFANDLDPFFRFKAGLVFNYHDFYGDPMIYGEDDETWPSQRVRYLPTPKDSPKYLQYPGSPVRIYFSLLVNWLKVIHNTTKTVTIVEGEKKATKACKEGVLAIGIGGVDCLGSPGQPGVLNDDLIGFTLKNRIVYICFDSDFRTNPNVQNAIYRAARSLRAKDADVRIVELPHGPNGETLGLDDYAVLHGENFKEEYAKLCAVAKPAPQYKKLINLNELRKMDIPDTAWIMKNMILKYHTTLLPGQGGAGKSMLGLSIGLHVAKGYDFLGLKTEKCNVLYLSREDNIGQIKRRIISGIEYYEDGIWEGDLSGSDFKKPPQPLNFDDLSNFNLPDVIETDIPLLEVKDNREVIELPQLVKLRHELKLFEGHTLVVTDNATDTLFVNPNDKDSVNPALKYMDKFAKENDCSFLLLAHPSKASAASNSVVAGSNAWRDSVRHVTPLIMMNPPEQASAGKEGSKTPPDEAVGLFYYVGKTNLGVSEHLRIERVGCAFRLKETTFEEDKLNELYSVGKEVFELFNKEMFVQKGFRTSGVGFGDLAQIINTKYKLNLERNDVKVHLDELVYRGVFDYIVAAKSKGLGARFILGENIDHLEELKEILGIEDRVNKRGKTEKKKGKNLSRSKLPGLRKKNKK